ncbi:MAG TPA: alpha/beta hydrolase, partial [Spirochaetota bacterium]
MKKFVKIVIGIVAVLFAALLIVGALSRDKIEIPAGFAGQYVDVNGVKIRYVQKGNGKDILLIHGTPGSIEDWNPVIDTLAQKFRVTAYDRPANGFSSAEGCDFSVAYNAKTAFALIDTLKLSKPLVVGHSYGAAVAMNMATENDPRVKGFVVESSSAYSYHARKTMLGRLIRLPLVGRGFSVIISSVAGGMIDKGMKMAFHPNEDAIPSGFIDMKKMMIA